MKTSFARLRLESFAVCAGPIRKRDLVRKLSARRRARLWLLTGSAPSNTIRYYVKSPQRLWRVNKLIKRGFSTSNLVSNEKRLLIGLQLWMTAVIFSAQHTPARPRCPMKSLSRRISDLGGNAGSFVSSSSRKKGAALAACALALVMSGCGAWWHAKAPSTTGSGASDAKVEGSSPAEADTSASIIRELEDRVKRDPEDFIAFNKLAGYYLQRLRETGSVQYLELTTRAAHASLRILPAEQNAGALAALAQAEFAAHDFAAARDHAQQLISLQPAKSYPYQLLGDALLELGDYEGAEQVFTRVRQGGEEVGAQTRLARLDTLRGRSDEAGSRLSNALSMALAEVPRPRETTAWCQWQLGELAFAKGDYATAERRYREALKTFPDYYRALGGLGRVHAARGDVEGAIEQYQTAVRRLPDPTFISMLGDLYKLSGRETEAARQYALVEQIARLNALNGTLYNRQLALFYADHDIKADEAYALASKEYEVRRDIYGADAVAWTALKAGKLDKAKVAIKEALRLGTQDARLFYHAGMIARSTGDGTSARNFLNRALQLNPQFDALQAQVARKALESS